MRKRMMFLSTLMLLWCFTPALHAADWVYLGNAHVDGQHDHDDIKVGGTQGRYRFLQIRVVNAPIQFDHIVVHYGNGEPQTIAVRDVIRAGGKSRAIELQGDRYVQSFELWYAKADPGSSKPELTLWGKH
jgi:hypothetical protein